MTSSDMDGSCSAQAFTLPALTKSNATSIKSATNDGHARLEYYDRSPTLQLADLKHEQL